MEEQEDMYLATYTGPLAGIEYRSIRLPRGTVVELLPWQAQILAQINHPEIEGLEDLQLQEASLDEESVGSVDNNEEEE